MIRVLTQDFSELACMLSYLAVTVMGGWMPSGQPLPQKELQWHHHSTTISSFISGVLRCILLSSPFKKLGKGGGSPQRHNAAPLEMLGATESSTSSLWVEEVGAAWSCTEWLTVAASCCSKQRPAPLILGGSVHYLELCEVALVFGGGGCWVRHKATLGGG